MDKRTPETPVPEGFIEQFRLESGHGALKVPTSISCDFRSTHPPVTKEAGDPLTNMITLLRRGELDCNPIGRRIGKSRSMSSHGLVAIVLIPTHQKEID